jgi:hypothetical protein
LVGWFFSPSLHCTVYITCFFFSPLEQFLNRYSNEHRFISTGK